MIWWQYNEEQMMIIKNNIIEVIKTIKRHIGDSQEDRTNYAYICMQIITEMVRK